MSNKPVFDYPVFAMGFRAFFALAGLSALALIAIWNAVSHGALHLNNYYNDNLWHAHEMLLGYAVAVIAGFLLTAVGNWTGKAMVTPDQLASLSFVWLYGRIAPFYAGLLPDALIALLDFSFLPLLTYFIAKPILNSGGGKNLVFVGMLLLMTLANGLIHWQILSGMSYESANGLNLLVAIIVLMIVVIAGRVFPFFTERGLSGVICIRNPLLDMLCIICTIAVFGFLLLEVSDWLLVGASLAALATNLLRIYNWFDRRVLYVPLLWILYIGYGWIILGFGLLALSAFQVMPNLLALHAFTVGGISVLTLGMMARVALGHTGRALKTSNLMAIAFLLLNLAALCRVLFPALIPTWYNGFLIVSSYSWLAAFSLFVFYYLPILLSSRVDGKAG